MKLCMVEYLRLNCVCLEGKLACERRHISGRVERRNNRKHVCVGRVKGKSNSGMKIVLVLLGE